MGTLYNNDLWIWGAHEKVRVLRNSIDPLSLNKSYFDTITLPDDAPQSIEYIPKKLMENVASVSVGKMHTMCVTKGHELWGWGNNDYGELGIGNFIDQQTPTFIMDGVKRVFAFYNMTFAIMEDDSLCGWGNNEGFVLQDNYELCKRPVLLFNNVKTVSASKADVMVVNWNGELWHWGDRSRHIDIRRNEYYQPPELYMSGIKDVTITPNDIPYFELTITENGDLYSRGIGDRTGGMLPWTAIAKYGDVPVKVLSNVSKAYIGYYYSLIILEDGRLYASGSNRQGQCGKAPCNKPNLIMHDVIEAAAGYSHSLALQSNGDLWIWGGDYCLEVGTEEKSHNT